jgi:hypothetical protein
MKRNMPSLQNHYRCQYKVLINEKLNAFFAYSSHLVKLFRYLTALLKTKHDNITIEMLNLFRINNNK